MTSPEVNPQPINQEDLNEILSNPAFQAAIQTAVAEGVNRSRPDMVLDYNNLTGDDANYLNRDQRGREGADARDFDAVRSLETIIPENEKQESALPAVARYRPYSAILKDINAEKVTPTHVEDNPFSDAEAPAKMDLLTDELAARITLESTDYSIKGADQDDTRQELLLDLQARGSLSDDEVMALIDKVANFDELIVKSENLVDEVLYADGGLVDQFKELVETGRQPIELFRGTDGNVTPAFRLIDKKLKQILDKIDNPIIRQVVLKDTNTELQRHLHRAERLAEQRKLDIEAIVIKPADVDPIVEPADAKPKNKSDDEIRAERAVKLEEKINDRAQEISDLLAAKSKELGSSHTALDIYYQYINGKVAPKYLAEQAANKTSVKLSESSMGKAMWRGVAKFVEEDIKARIPSMSQDELDSKIQEELKILRSVFDKHDQPEVARPAKRNTAPKNSRGSRIAAGFNKLRQIRSANMAKK